MPSKLTTPQNQQILMKRANRGEFTQYFNKLSRSDTMRLSSAIKEDDINEIGLILSRNLSAYGGSFEAFFTGAYDEVIEKIGRDVLDESIDEIEEDIEESIEADDYDRLEDLRENLEEIISPEVSLRSEKIINKLDKVLFKVNIPKHVRRRAVNLVRKKGINSQDVTKANIYKKWGRNQKPALVVFTKRGIATWRGLTSQDFKDLRARRTKPKVTFTRTSRQRIQPTPKIVSRGTQELSNKEKIFIRARSNKRADEVYNEYLKKFGKIRPKGFLLGEIREGLG